MLPRSRLLADSALLKLREVRLRGPRS